MVLLVDGCGFDEQGDEGLGGMVLTLRAFIECGQRVLEQLERLVVALENGKQHTGIDKVLNCRVSRGSPFKACNKTHSIMYYQASIIVDTDARWRSAARAP